jgi:2-polyprenyl-3-methyl-5-hydroxy-6-metoxy-1,4-benzoquinol methylase
LQPTAYYERWFSRRISSRPTISKRILFNEGLRGLNEYLREHPDKRCELLDIGCGAGHFISRLQHRPELNITGIDITDKVIDRLQELYPYAQFKKINFSEPQDMTYPYDIVTAIEVIEHIPYDKQSIFIENIRKSLKPGALLFLTTPNKGRIHRIPKAFRNTQPVEDWLTINELKNLLHRDFSPITIETCIWYFPTRLIDIIFKRLFYPLHMGIEQTLLRNTKLGCHIVVKAIRK